MEAEAGISTQQAAPAQAPVQQAQPAQQQAPQYDQQYAQPANNYAQAATPAAAKPNPFAKLGEWVKGHTDPRRRSRTKIFTVTAKYALQKQWCPWSTSWQNRKSF